MISSGAILAFDGKASFAQDKVRIKEIRKKMKLGEPLTAEEKELLDLAKKRGLKRKKIFRYEDEVGASGLVRVDSMNVIDKARFSIAEIEMKRDRYKEAITELERVANESPDDSAVSAAHLSMGNIYRTCLDEPTSALEHYTKVKGRLADIARIAIIDL